MKARLLAGQDQAPAWTPAGGLGRFGQSWKATTGIPPTPADVARASKPCGETSASSVSNLFLVISVGARPYRPYRVLVAGKGTWFRSKGRGALPPGSPTACCSSRTVRGCCTFIAASWWPTCSPHFISSRSNRRFGGSAERRGATCLSLGETLVT
jgi:hypothetical protein